MAFTKRINLTADFALTVSQLGTLSVVRGPLTQRVTGDLSHAFSECVGFDSILAKLRTLHDAVLIASERATKHTRQNWLRTIDQLRSAIVAVQGDEQAWTDEVLRLAGARARAAATWHAGVKAALHNLYVYARTHEQAAKELCSLVRTIEREQMEVA